MDYKLEDFMRVVYQTDRSFAPTLARCSAGMDGTCSRIHRPWLRANTRGLTVSKTHVFFILLTFFLMEGFLQPITVHAFTNNAGEDSYTIHFFDKNGKEVRTWTGSISEAQKILQVEDAKRRQAGSEVNPQINR